jgi:hypothetical protein
MNEVESDLSEVDRAAFARAIDIMLRHHERIYRIDFRRRLATKESRDETGRHAAYACQVGSLGLKPWQVAPCDAEINTTDAPGFEQRCTEAALAILGRLLAANLSRFELDLAITQRQKKLPRRGGCVSAPSCEKDVYTGSPTRLGFWPFFGANCASRFPARCRGNAYR